MAAFVCSAVTIVQSGDFSHLTPRRSVGAFFSTTLAGVAVQALVASWQAVSFVAGGPLDWSQAQVYQLVVNLFGAAGEAVPEFIYEADEEGDGEA